MSVRNAPSGTIRAALRYPAFRWLAGGLAVSQTGDWLYNLALVVLVFDRTHSPLWAGVTTAARIVPIVVLGPLGGLFADKFDRRRLMIGCDAARMVLMGLLAAVAAARLPILLAPVTAAAATAAAAAYVPCAAAITPRLVSDVDLPGANAVRSAVTGLGVVAGPALGGVLLFFGSPAVAFGVNGLTFGASALCVLAIRPRTVFRHTRSPGDCTGLLQELARGVTALRAHPQTMRLVGADIMCSILYGTQTVLLLEVSRQIGLGTAGYGYMFSGIGIGGLLGTALASRTARCSRPHYVRAAALAAVGLPMPLLAVVHWTAAVIFLVSLTGTGALLVEILTETWLQRTLDEQVFGRAYGLAVPASYGGIAAGSLLAPALISAVGVTGTLIVTGAAVTAYAVTLLRPASTTAPAVSRQPATTELST
jgi:MFS family permease